MESTNKSIQTSLTAPWDRPETIMPSVELRQTRLTQEELSNAISANLDTSIIEKDPPIFPRVERLYVDPSHNNQTFCLHSFTPSRGATPDDHGVFGFMKCRGAFANLSDANARAEHIIEFIDSYNQIQTALCGTPFPVCADTKNFVKEVKSVDIRKQAIDAISSDVNEKRMHEKKEIEEIKQREEKLLENSKAVQENTFVEDPLDRYTTLHMKKANLVHTYLETQKKMNTMKEKIQNVYGEIREMDMSDAELSRSYYNHYMDARRKAHIPDDVSQDNWFKYLCEDAVLDFDY